MDVNGTPLSLYVNHLKSMMGGRAQTKSRRLVQAKRVAKIVDYWWASGGGSNNFIVVGDMNDYPDASSALRPPHPLPTPGSGAFYW